MAAHKPQLVSMAACPSQLAPVLASLILVLLLTPLATGIYDFGPVKPYHYGPLPDPNGALPDKADAVAQWGATIGCGFPTWYRDDLGRVCEPCTAYDPEGVNGQCLSTYSGLDAGERFGPGATLDATILPDELFYYHASADTGAVPVSVLAAGGLTTAPDTYRLLYENGVEGAYSTGPRIPGTEMVFERTRFLIHCPTIDPPPGKEYVFFISTPWSSQPPGHTYGPYVSAVGGKRCVFVTEDVGITPGHFGDLMAGTVDSYMFNDPSPATGSGFMGSFPAADVGYIGNSVQKSLVVNFTVAPIGTVPATFQTYKHTAFVTSCKEFDKASLVRIDRAVLHITEKPAPTPPDTVTATIEVFAVAGPSETLRVFIPDVKAPDGLDQACDLSHNSLSSLQIPKGSFGEAYQPTAYFASCTFTWPATPGQMDSLAKQGLEVGVHSLLGPTVATAVAKPSFSTADAYFNGTYLTVYATSTNILQKFQVGYFCPSGKYYNPLGAQSVDGKGEWAVETQAVPQHVHACPAYLAAKPQMSECTAIEVAYVAGETSSALEGATTLGTVTARIQPYVKFDATALTATIVVTKARVNLATSKSPMTVSVAGTSTPLGQVSVYYTTAVACGPPSAAACPPYPPAPGSIYVGVATCSAKGLFDSVQQMPAGIVLSKGTTANFYFAIPGAASVVFAATVN